MVDDDEEERRFRPTDAELVNHYLRLKINGNEKECRVIREVDVCKHEPWDLPDLSAIPTTDPETTLEELDGTHPGQNAFVLCRLFRKQDETVEDSNIDIAELADESPLAIKSSPGDTESELEMPQDNQSSASRAGPSRDHDTQPMPLQIKQEPGSSSREEFKGSGQDPDDNDDYITAFLDSILTDGNDGIFFEGAGSEQFDGMNFCSAGEGLLPIFGAALNQEEDWAYSEEKIEEKFPPVLKSCLLAESNVTDHNFGSIAGDITKIPPSYQPDSDQHRIISVLESSFTPAALDSESPHDTGIIIRPRPQVEAPLPKLAAQGNARRRLHVQCKLQIGPTLCKARLRDSMQSNEDQKLESLDTVEKVVEKSVGVVSEEPTEGTRSSIADGEAQIPTSEEVKAKLIRPRTIHKDTQTSSGCTFSTLQKGLHSLCSSINLFSFITLLVLTLSLMGALLCSSSRY
ncbi:hypothetical protein MLD38_002977 [Melastoma candidum]|uniref:Uncharacterized protein n=1 Tax=Melastoma candidum TaxID=119954 RepID=A0ACB9S2G5_9MYRT|nr:hypothetical protein MLD38_002977 [Melastoma candidum]